LTCFFPAFFAAHPAVRPLLEGNVNVSAFVRKTDVALALESGTSVGAPR
jgi:hypothetical protein